MPVETPHTAGGPVIACRSTKMLDLAVKRSCRCLSCAMMEACAAAVYDSFARRIVVAASVVVGIAVAECRGKSGFFFVKMP
eukprot:scaffold122510_cov56-Attheya_sp.AAC.2